MENNIENEIAKIRKKTFNNELKDLVSRINSSPTNENLKPSGNTDLDNESILKNIHSLFYKIAALEYSDSIFQFDPIEPFIDNFDDLVEILTNNSDIENFAVLEYHSEENSYKIENSTFNTKAVNEIIISPSESIYKYLVNSNEIVNLNSEIINENEFDYRFIDLSKLDLFILSGKTLLNKLVNKYPVFFKNYDSDLLLPIYIFFKNTNTEKETFIDNISNCDTYLYYYMLTRKSETNISKIHELYKQVEKIGHEKITNDRVSFYIFNMNITDPEKFYFLHKFFSNKINSNISIKSKYITLNLNKVVGYFIPEDIKFVLHEIEKFNKLYPNAIEVVRIRNSSKINVISEILKSRL